MKKPEYANAFSVTYNPQLNEVVVNFIHEYPIITPRPDEAAGSVQVKTETMREDVSGVVLPKAVAEQLLAVIGQAMGKKQDNG